MTSAQLNASKEIAIPFNLIVIIFIKDVGDFSVLTDFLPPLYVASADASQGIQGVPELCGLLSQPACAWQSILH